MCEKSCGNVAKATRVPREFHPDAERLDCLDAFGLKSLLLAVATTCSTSAGTCIKYTYDGAGNLKTRIDVTGTSTFTYDFENRVTAKNTPAGNSSVTYDAAGNVTKYTDASGSVSYTYDANNNVVDVVEPGGTKTNCGTLGTLCTLFGYDKGNRPKSVNYPNGVIVTIVYNTPGQETSVVAKLGSIERRRM